MPLLPTEKVPATAVPTETLPTEVAPGETVPPPPVCDPVASAVDDANNAAMAALVAMIPAIFFMAILPLTKLSVSNWYTDVWLSSNGVFPGIFLIFLQ